MPSSCQFPKSCARMPEVVCMIIERPVWADNPFPAALTTTAYARAPRRRSSRPPPDGLTPVQLVSAVRALTDRYPLAGLGITEYEPGRASDRAVLAELIPALLAGAR